jgi:phosphocarrier protein
MTAGGERRAAGGDDDRRTRSITIVNQRGLHARAAAKFVKLAGQFDAEITVSRSGQEVSGLSIMGLMMFAAGPGSEIELSARGAQADEALDALQELVESRFGED